jgi:hypothetical protein
MERILDNIDTNRNGKDGKSIKTRGKFPLKYFSGFHGNPALLVFLETTFDMGN